MQKTLLSHLGAGCCNGRAECQSLMLKTSKPIFLADSLIARFHIAKCMSTISNCVRPTLPCKSPCLGGSRQKHVLIPLTLSLLKLCLFGSRCLLGLGSAGNSGKQAEVIIRKILPNSWVICKTTHLSLSFIYGNYFF